MKEIEQRFYKLYGIPEAKISDYGATYFWDTVAIDDNTNSKRYEPINERIMIKLICIINTIPCVTLVSTRIESLKDEILEILCTHFNDDIKKKVQEIF